MLSFSKSTPIFLFNKDTCYLLISGNSFGLEIHKNFTNLIKTLDTTCCRKIKIEIDLNFYNVSTVVSLKNLFLFAKSNYSKVDVDWNISDDFDDIDVLEKICKIKINRLYKVLD